MNLGSCLYIFNLVVIILNHLHNIVVVVSRLNREMLLVW